MSKNFIKYKLEFDNGPSNGGIRYYDSFSIALRAGRSYITRNRDYPEYVGFDIFGLRSDYSSERIFSQIG